MGVGRGEVGGGGRWLKAAGKASLPTWICTSLTAWAGGGQGVGRGRGEGPASGQALSPLHPHRK